MTENNGITYMTADEMMSGTAMPPNGAVMFTIREVEAIVARHVAEAERYTKQLERAAKKWKRERDRAEAALAEAEQKGARAALLAAADALYNGAGDPEQALYDYGGSPWLRDRATQVGGQP